MDARKEILKDKDVAGLFLNHTCTPGQRQSTQGLTVTASAILPNVAVSRCGPLVLQP
jgi:hypothetical protein